MSRIGQLAFPRIPDKAAARDLGVSETTARLFRAGKLPKSPERRASLAKRLQPILERRVAELAEFESAILALWNSD